MNSNTIERGLYVSRFPKIKIKNNNNKKKQVDFHRFRPNNKLFIEMDHLVTDSTDFNNTKIKTLE